MHNDNYYIELISCKKMTMALDFKLPRFKCQRLGYSNIIAILRISLPVRFFQVDIWVGMPPGFWVIGDGWFIAGVPIDRLPTGTKESSICPLFVDLLLCASIAIDGYRIISYIQFQTFPNSAKTWRHLFRTIVNLLDYSNVMRSEPCVIAGTLWTRQFRHAHTRIQIA